MKMIGSVALAAALCVSSVAPAGQRSKSPIVVTGQRATVQQWTQSVSRTLGDNMRYPAAVAGSVPDSGLATVRFRCDDTGRPVDLVLAQKSGSRLIDRAALRTVSRIRSLPPMPAGLNAGQMVQANLIFAASPSDYERLVAKASDRARQRLASTGGGDQVAAIDITASAPAGSQ